MPQGVTGKPGSQHWETYKSVNHNYVALHRNNKAKAKKTNSKVHVAANNNKATGCKTKPMQRSLSDKFEKLQNFKNNIADKFSEKLAKLLKPAADGMKAANEGIKKSNAMLEKVDKSMDTSRAN